MALTRLMTRLELAGAGTPNRASEVNARSQSLPSLSQRKLNALGLPLAYVDGSRRYRFVNKAFLEWTGLPFMRVIGRELREVDGGETHLLYEAYVEAALGGEPTGFERLLAAPGRSPHWIRVDYYPDRGTDGEVRGFLVTYADVDQLKRLELEAGAREHRLRLVTDSVGSPIVHFDRQLRIRFANKPFGNWIGVAPDDVLGRGIHELIAGGTFVEMDEHIERAFAGAKVSFERRERKATGELRWVRITLFPDRAIGGRVSGVFAVMTDIDDDIAVRDALKSQEEQLRLFADNIPGPIAYLDRASTYTFVNQAFANWVARPQDEIYGRSPFEVLAPDVASFLRPVLERALDGEHVEYERIDRHARRAAALGARPRRTGPRRARKAARALLHRVRHPRSQADGAGAGRARGAAATVHGQHPGSRGLPRHRPHLRVRQRRVPAAVRPGARPGHRQDGGRGNGSRRPRAALDVRGPRAGGRGDQLRAGTGRRGRPEALDARAHGAGSSVDGAIQGIYVVAHDITDLKIAQDALAARESQLRAIMDGVPAPVAYIDRDERCRYVNRAFLEYFGLESRRGRRAAPARRRRARHLRERAVEDQPRARGRVDLVRPAWCRARTASAGG